jgi:membrane protein
MHFFKRLWHLFKSGEIQTIAGALSFATLLSFIPFLAVTLATIKYFDGLSVLYPKAEALVLAYFQDPTGVDGAQILAKFFRRIQMAKFGGWGIVGLILSSAMMVNNMERGIHMIWQLKSRRSLLSRLSLSALIMVLFPVALAVYAGIASLKSNTDLWLMVSPQHLNFFITVLILTTIYKILPNIRVPLVPALVGGFFTTIGLIVLYGSFKSITKSIFVLGKMYGSFAAFPTLLLWIFLTWMVILLGSVVTASLTKNVPPKG